MSVLLLHFVSGGPSASRKDNDVRRRFHLNTCKQIHQTREGNVS